MAALGAALRGRIEQILSAITLDDLCQRKRQRSGGVMYYI
jgi:Rrf2 family transcriptional regulator, cysteine metabolism repressor